MKKNMTREFKVGLFIVFCLAALAYMTLSTGKVNFKRGGYYIYIMFDECAGLQKKAPVMLNGFEMGKVEDVQMVYESDRTRAKLKIWLRDEAKIRLNPKVSIKTLGLMGEKYVQIASHRGEGFVSSGAVLEGETFIDIDALMQLVQDLCSDLTKNVNSLLTTFNQTVVGNQDTITQTLKNFESTSKNFDDFSADIKKHPWKLLFKGKEKGQ